MNIMFKQYCSATDMVTVCNPCTPPSISSQSTATQTICFGGAFTAISVTASGYQFIYQWSRNTIASTSGGTAVGTNSNSIHLMLQNPEAYIIITV